MFDDIFDALSEGEDELRDYDLTFKYSHDQLGFNPIVDKEGKPFHVCKSPTGLGRRITRVFTQCQRDYVETNNGEAIFTDIIA